MTTRCAYSLRGIASGRRSASGPAILASASVLFGSLAVLAAPALAGRSLEYGRALAIAGECDEALGHLLGAYQREETKSEALEWYGYCLRATDQGEQARRLARSVLAGGPDAAVAAVAQNLLGLVALDRGEPEEAIEHFEAARTAAPLDEHDLNLAIALGRAGDEDRALTTWSSFAERQVRPEHCRIAATEEEWDRLSGLWLELRPDGPIMIAGSVVPPVEVQAKQPKITGKARGNRTQGRVILEGVIGRDGLVRDLEVVEGLPDGLTEAALKAVSKWRYEPARFRDAPVGVYQRFEIDFRLR